MVNYKELRKDHPLRPSDIGIVEGKILGVWRNWDTVLVQCSEGKEILKWDTKGEELIMEARLVGSQYLLLTLGFYIGVCDFKIFSFMSKTWSRRFPITTLDYAIAGIHPLNPEVAIRNETDACTEIWNIESQEKVKIYSPDFDVFAFGADGLSAASGYEGLYLLKDEAPLKLEVAHERNEIVALEWFKPSQLIVSYWKAGVSIFDVEIKREKQIIECNGEYLTIDVSLGIVAACDEGKMFVFEETENRVTEIPDAFGFCFSKAEAKIAILENAGIRFIEDFQSGC